MKNNRIIALLALVICLPLLGILPEHPKPHKRKNEQAAQAARKRRKQEKPQQLFPPITTTTTSSTAAFSAYVTW